MTQIQRPPTLIPSVIAPVRLPIATASTHGFAERAWERFSTLRGRFSLLLIMTLIVTCLTALAVFVSSFKASNDLQTISQSIASVSAAQVLVPYLENIDAHAADYLANPENSAQISCVDALTGTQLGQFSVHECAGQIIDTDLLELNHQLFLAGQNTPYPGFQTALEQTQYGLQLYTGDINLMRHEFGLAPNPANPHDPHIQQAYQALQDAQTVLRDRLPGNAINEADLPSCTLDHQKLNAETWPTQGIETNILCLSALGKTNLDSAYQNYVGYFGIGLGIVFFLSIYSCFLLIWATWNMITTTHKIFNLGLTLALLAAFVATGAILMDFNDIYGNNGSFSVITTNYHNIYQVGTLEQEITQTQADQARWLQALLLQDPATASKWHNDLQTQIQQANQQVMNLNNTQIQNDWQLYNAQLQAVSTAPLTQAENQHTGPASQTFQTLINAIQQLRTSRYRAVDISNPTSVLSNTRNSMQLLTTLWAFIFPVLGVVGAWGISRRLKDL